MKYLSAIVISVVFVLFIDLLRSKKKAPVTVMVFKDGKWTKETNHVWD